MLPAEGRSLVLHDVCTSQVQTQQSSGGALQLPKPLYQRFAPLSILLRHAAPILHPARSYRRACLHGAAVTATMAWVWLALQWMGQSAGR